MYSYCSTRERRRRGQAGPPVSVGACMLPSCWGDVCCSGAPSEARLTHACPSATGLQRPMLWGRRRRSCVGLQGPGQVHGLLEVRGEAKLDVDVDVVREPTHEQLGLLKCREVARVAHHYVEAISVVLQYCGCERKAHQLGEACTPPGRPKAESA